MDTQQTLLPEARKRTGPPDWWLLIAKARGMPEGWAWFKLEVKGHPAPREQCVSLVTGAVCKETFKSGPRKGEKNWGKRDRSTERELAVTFAELDAFMAKWEAETGLCSACGGGGETMTGWSAESGSAYARCRPCAGSGKAKRTPKAGTSAA